MAPSNGTTSTPPKLVVTFPPNHSTLQWHLQWHHPQSWPSPSPPLAHYNGTLQWHPEMAPCNGTHCTQQWPTSTPSKLAVTRLAHYCNGTTASPHHSTLQWHPAMAPSNGTMSTPAKLVVTLPSPHHSTLQWHPAMAPCNGTQQWHHAHSPQSWSSPSPSTTVHYNGTLRWHPAMAPRPLHPALAPWCHVQSAKVVRRPPPYWK